MKCFLNFKKLNSQDCYNLAFAFDKVTSPVVLDVVESFKTSKSPGFDNVSGSVVKLTSKAIVRSLTG